MKAARVNQWGKPVHIEHVPTPSPADDEVLVRIRAASINPIDAAVIAGDLAFMINTPMTPGTDFSGEVVRAGADAAFKPGDEVFGMIPFRSGTFAEYATPRIGEMALKPRSLDHATASVIPMPALAAWQLLYDLGQLRTGEQVLIAGVAGAVGSLAAQLAHNKGATVHGVDLPDRVSKATALPVDRWIAPADYEQAAARADLIVDLVGGAFQDAAYRHARRGARYVSSVLYQLPQEVPQQRGFRALGLNVAPRAEQLAALAAEIDARRLKITAGRSFALDDIPAALTYRARTRLPGKIVLLMD